MPRRIQLGLLSAAVAIGVVAALTVSSSQASPRSAKPARLTVGVQVLKMNPAAGRTLRGVGLVTATLTDAAGRTQTTHSRVAFTAAAGKSCRILNLTLNQLHLSLLGLNVDLAKVVLKITGIKQGHPGGGLLGSLLCSLASTKLSKAQRASAARQLTAPQPAGLGRGPQQGPPRGHSDPGWRSAGQSVLLAVHHHGPGPNNPDRLAQVGNPHRATVPCGGRRFVVGQAH